MFKAKKAPGFRFSATDAIAIVLCVASTAYLQPRIGDPAWLFPVVLGHFFLFCNVFRVRRNYELMWAAAFLVNFVAWTLSGRFDWLWVLACQSPLTIAAISAEVLSENYHGIFCGKATQSAEDSSSVVQPKL